MDSLRVAADGAGIRGLIDALYDNPLVQGFALRVHGEFVAGFRGNFGSSYSIEQMLKTGMRPKDWLDICFDAGFSSALSPVYVVVYVNSTDLDGFRKTLNVPDTVPPDHAVFLEFSPPFYALADRKQHRPLIGGISASSNAKTEISGTLGGHIDDNGQIYALSCEHVFLGVGDDVLQQSPGDGGKVKDRVATTTRVAGLTLPTGYTAAAPYNRVDAALAEVDLSRTGVSSGVRVVGKVRTYWPEANMSLGDDVVFVGKESDRQEGLIYSFHSRVKINIEGTAYNFGDVFEIRPRVVRLLKNFTKGGDSGSWVLEEINGTYKLCGLLIADNGNNTALCCFSEYALTDLQLLPAGTFTLH
jgi:hypothetical protein